MEKLKKHSIKITLWTIITVVVFLVAWSVRLWGFINKVDANTLEITTMKWEVQSLNNMVIETRNDVKRLVNNEKSK